MAADRFPEPEVVLFSCGLKHLIEIRYAKRVLPSHMSAVTKPKAGSRFPNLCPPSWKIDMTS